ncbi:MAG: hypothetical protein OEY58_19715 [Gammaproteobacteria bacterium]|nr:hypothetical protein [Gammaproteobacteria bacterium]
MTQRNSTTITVTEQQLLNDMDVSSWVKQQISETTQADIIDATHNVELLIMVLEQRCIAHGLKDGKTTFELSNDVVFTEHELIADPTVQYWLRIQIKETRQRDPLEALKDAQLLLAVLEQRCIRMGIIQRH